MEKIGKAIRLISNLLRIGLRRPERLFHVMGAALAASEEVRDPACDMLRMPEISVNDLLGHSAAPIELRLVVFPKIMGAPTLLESACLLILLRKASAARVRELGTHGGLFITQLALNLKKEGEISTSPPFDPVTVFDKYQGVPLVEEARRSIRFINHETLGINEADFQAPADLVFVDGDHDFESVRIDSEKGWSLLRSGGIMVWHDFSVRTIDVVRYLLESSYPAVHITSTRLAFAIKP